MAPVRLNIAPPYWKQPWFFAAEFSVFIFLVLLSFRLSYRFLIVSRLLSLLSIIMFIEFIQTAVGETFSQSSPVLDFSIQVFVAMLILPVEGFLRRYFLQALAKRNEERLQKMVNEGEKVPEYEPEYPEPVVAPTAIKKKKK
jgi:TRAP-type C4-dicarboxylate transport system permease small subunit